MGLPPKDVSDRSDLVAKEDRRHPSLQVRKPNPLGDDYIELPVEGKHGAAASHRGFGARVFRDVLLTEPQCIKRLDPPGQRRHRSNRLR